MAGFVLIDTLGTRHPHSLEDPHTRAVLSLVPKCDPRTSEEGVLATERFDPRNAASLSGTEHN